MQPFIFILILYKSKNKMIEIVNKSLFGYGDASGKGDEDGSGYGNGHDLT